ncbi:MAG: ATP-binding domain-containing protein [Thermaerobacter sp.]|nr:ATP-binding domain-containing protein [Thermaerobacter sp.]
MGEHRPETDAEERAYLSRVLSRIRGQQAREGEGAARVGDELAGLRRWWTDEEAREATQLLDRGQNLPLLAGLEAEAAARARRLRQLSLEARRPYFGRVDFVETDPEPRHSAEAFYVGLGGVWDDDGEPLVIDWRTPMAGLYYDAEPGHAHFEGPNGRVAGTLAQKRQYQIERGALVGFFNTTLHIGDDLLARAMAARGGTRMPSIVATIQREQNRAIRDAAHRVLVVTGPAGSGKTAVALQRLAYLLYHRPKLVASEMLFVVPNRIFADYVSDVLPELGEENPRYATWDDLVAPWLPAGQVEGRTAVVDAWMAARLDPLRVEGIRLRGDARFVSLIDGWLMHLAQEPPPFRDVVWEGVVVATRQELDTWWQGRWGARPISVRLGLIQEQLAERIRGARRRVVARVRADLIDSQVLLGDDGLRQAVERRVEQGAEQLWAWVDQGEMVDWRALYLSFYGPNTTWRGEATRMGFADLDRLLGDVRLRLQHGALPFEDVGPLAYMRASLLRPQLPWPVRLVMVEEAHELTVCQLAVLHRLVPDLPVTMMGDGKQALMPGLSWSPEQPLPWPARDVGRVVLTKSYRSAPAIAAWCRRLLAESAGPPTAAVEWPAGSGLGVVAAPTLVPASPQAWADALTREVGRTPNDATVGVICGTSAEARAVAGHLGPALGRPVALVDHQASEFSGGIMVVPVALVGGLEFDAVVVADVSAYQAADTRHALYVAASRARHRLTLVWRGAWPAWIPPEASPAVSRAEPADS